MDMLPRLVVPILVVGCLAAQQQSRGVLAGAPTAVLVDDGLGPGLDSQTRVHRSGFAAGPTLPLPSGSTQPNLREILAPHFLGGVVPLDIDDISLGRDDVLIDEFGIIDVPPSSWGVLSFSLRQGAVGEAGYAIANVAAGGSVGASLFSWLLPGSSLPSQLVGPGVRAELSHSVQDLGLPAGVEVDAVDFPVMLGREQTGLVAFEPGFSSLNPNDEIYFTVSSATVAAVPPGWWSPFPVAPTASGATILVVRRQTPTAPWQTPTVWQRWVDLGLAQSEDIDALAVNAIQEKVLFSVTGTARDQFLFADFGTDGGPAPPLTVASAPGGPVSTQVGKVQNDDVDAVCTLDPLIGSAGSPPPGGAAFGSSCGAPRSGLLGVPSVHASAFRRRSGAQTFFDTWMVGWPPNTGVTAGIAVLFVTIGDDLTLFPVGPIHLRNTADPVPGNPCTYPLPMPAGYSLSGQRVTFRWAAISAGFTELAEAWPVQVCL